MYEERSEVRKVVYCQTSPCEIIVFLSTLLLSTMPEGERNLQNLCRNSRLSIFKCNLCLYPQPPAEGKNGNTSALDVLCQTKGMTDSTARGGLGYKIHFAGLNSRLNKDLLGSFVMAGTLA